MKDQHQHMFLSNSDDHVTAMTCWGLAELREGTAHSPSAKNVSSGSIALEITHLVKKQSWNNSSFGRALRLSGASLVAQTVKNLPTVWET